MAAPDRAAAPSRPALIRIGEIVGAHGLRGEVRLRSFAAEPADIKAYSPLLGADGARICAIEALRPSGGAPDLFVARLAGIASRDAAEALAGTASPRGPRAPAPGFSAKRSSCMPTSSAAGSRPRPESSSGRSLRSRISARATLSRSRLRAPAGQSSCPSSSASSRSSTSAIGGSWSAPIRRRAVSGCHENTDERSAKAEIKEVDLLPDRA